MTEAIYPLTPESPSSWLLQAARSSQETTDIQRLAALQQRKTEHVIASLASNRVAFLDCVHHIALLRLAHKEALSPNLQVAEAVHGLRGNKASSDGVTLFIEHEKRDGGVLSITADTRTAPADGVLERQWTVSAFAHHEAVQRYTETIVVPARPGFEGSETTSKRTLGPQDVIELQRLVMAACVGENERLAPQSRLWAVAD